MFMVVMTGGYWSAVGVANKRAHGLTRGICKSAAHPAWMGHGA